MVDGKSENVIEDTYNNLLNDDRAYNVCLVKHIIENNLVPYYISFCFWYDAHLVSCKLFLNKDLKTFKLLSGEYEVFGKIKSEELFDKLNKFKFELSSNSKFSLTNTFDDHLQGLFIVNKNRR